MRARWWLSLSCLGLICWQARAPLPPWEGDLSAALADTRPTVLLVASAQRPQTAATQRAVDQAWAALRPEARRVHLEHCDPRAGRAAALALCVFAPGGRLAARWDGPLDELTLQEWLPCALDAAVLLEQRGERARTDPRQAFENADLALRLGNLEAALRGFEELCRSDAGLRAQAHERLARLAVQRGDLVGARDHANSAVDAQGSERAAARLALTQGLIELAEREHRAACTTLSLAATRLSCLGDCESDSAWLALARAQVARGEDSRAIATLEQLARASTSPSARAGARTLADQLRTPPPPPTH